MDNCDFDITIDHCILEPIDPITLPSSPPVPVHDFIYDAYLKVMKLTKDVEQKKEMEMFFEKRFGVYKILLDDLPIDIYGLKPSEFIAPLVDDKLDFNQIKQNFKSVIGHLVRPFEEIRNQPKNRDLTDEQFRRIVEQQIEAKKIELSDFLDNEIPQTLKLLFEVTMDRLLLCKVKWTKAELADMFEFDITDLGTNNIIEIEKWRMLTKNYLPRFYMEFRP